MEYSEEDIKEILDEAVSVELAINEGEADGILLLRTRLYEMFGFQEED